MTYSIEFQKISKDSASKITTQVSKTSVMSFQFKNIVLKLIIQKAKCRKNLSVVGTEQLVEAVLMKKNKKKHKDKKVCRENAWEKLSRN